MKFKNNLTVLILSLIILMAMGNSAFAAGCDIYVSTYGSSAASGGFNDPVDKISTAILKAKNIGAASTNIYVRGGNYYVDEPIVIDETVGDNIKISAYNNENVILTGGNRITGWKEAGNGIYFAKVNGYDYIRSLTVNGMGAKRAYTEIKNHIMESIGTDPYFKQGVVVDSSALPSGFTGKHAEIKYEYKWQDFMLKIDYAKPHPSDSAKTVLYFKQHEGPTMYYSWGNYFTNNPITISNDLTLLDSENEFYFDIDNDILYYKPFNGVDMAKAEVWAAKENEILSIKGSINNKISNITVEGITFANIAYDKLEYEGYANIQAANDYDINTDKSALNPNNGIMPAAAAVSWAENVSFINNKFINIDKVGLGLYEGVNNSSVIGNVFSDIGHSAITVGLPSHMIKPVDGYTDVAYNKPAWACFSYLYDTPQCANDGDVLTYWSSNSGKAEECWWAIDLEKAYTINKIMLSPRGDRNYDIAEARMNFEIQASNNKDFSTFDVIASQGNEDFGIGNVWTSEPNTSAKYRYIRVYKKAGAISEIRHFKVLTTDMGGKPEKEVCKNNIISNNYIVRAGADMFSAAGIQTYITANTTISNNYLRDLPATAVSAGYGWSGGSNGVAVNNKIINNRFENYTQRLYDVGGIYVLGDELGMEVSGNYLKNSRFGPGGWYPDEARGSTQQPIRVTGNVFEDIPYWSFIWNASTKNMVVSDNYTTNPKYSHTACENLTVNNNTLYVKAKPSAAVTNIINAAGISAEYAEIMNDVPVIEKDVEVVTNYTNDSSMLWISDANVHNQKGNYLENLIYTGNWWNNNLPAGNLSSEYTDFVNALQAAKSCYSSASTMYEVSVCRTNLINAMEALLDSGAFNDRDNLEETVTSSLLSSIAP